MKKITFLTALLILSGILFVRCSDDAPQEGNTPNPPKGNQKYYNVIYGVSSKGNSGTYAQAFEKLDAGQTITFKGKGFEIPSVRTARVYGSSSGKYLYNLSYGGGEVQKFEIQGGQNYKTLFKTNVELKVGTKYPRWKPVNDSEALVHNPVTEHIYEKTGTKAYKYTKATANLLIVNLKDMSLGKSVSLEIPRIEGDDTYIWRMDSPVVSGGKAYYGVAKGKLDPKTGKSIRGFNDYKATTFVVDYPSLTNPKVITSEIGKGQNYGYRMPSMQFDEKGDIYQMVREPGKILRIKNGEYDNSYDFDLAKALGLNKAGANAWFYVGNGIGYVPFYDAEKGSGSDKKNANWGVARIDIYNKTAVKLNLPNNLWLWYYQNGILGRDGKFYMAIAPLGQDGHIYKFDPTSTSPDGFETGAVLKTGADSFYLGVY